LTNQEDYNYGITNNLYDDELDLQDFSNFLQRNRKLIAKFAFSGLGLALSLLFVTPRTWKGEFQIVLNEASNIFDNKSLSSGQEDLINLFTQGEKGNSLKTQIGILKSPSVLLNVFEFVKSEKKQKNSSFEKTSFKDWSKNLKFINDKETSILTIQYFDKNKALILPVLDRISDSYQKYSLKERKRSLQLVSNYLEEQLDIYEQKTFNSLRNAQQFAIDQNITILDETELDKEIPNALDIEKIRLEAAGKIKQSNFISDQINKTGNDTESLIFIARSVEELFDSGGVLSKQLVEIDRIQNEISYKEKIYTSEDTSLNLIKSKRDNLIEILRSNILSIINSEILLAKTQLESSERPKGVIINYKRLLSKASADKNTLSELNKQYRYLSLEMAKTNDPWELITSPTLYEKPDSPNKKRFVFIGLLLSLLFGAVYAIYKEKKDDNIISKKDVTKNTNLRNLGVLNPYKNDSFSENITLISKGILPEVDGDIGIISINKINKELSNKITIEFDKQSSASKTFFCVNLLKAIKYPNSILIIELGKTKKSQFYEVLDKLTIQKKKIVGIIFIKN
tara:strand:- start:19 stop:1722 length:1704 start_codon:yes stop_codon:yes gene_type:complete